MAALDSRAKGNRAELEVQRVFEYAGWACRRVPNSGGLWIPGDLAWTTTPPIALHVEVKRRERLAIPEWLRQSYADAPSGSIPSVIFRQSKTKANGPCGDWHIVLPLVEFCEIVKEQTA